MGRGVAGSLRERDSKQNTETRCGAEGTEQEGSKEERREEAEGGLLEEVGSGGS